MIKSRPPSQSPSQPPSQPLSQPPIQFPSQMIGDLQELKSLTDLDLSYNAMGGEECILFLLGLYNMQSLAKLNLGILLNRLSVNRL